MFPPFFPACASGNAALTNTTRLPLLNWLHHFLWLPKSYVVRHRVISTAPPKCLRGSKCDNHNETVPLFSLISNKYEYIRSLQEQPFPLGSYHSAADCYNVSRHSVPIISCCMGALELLEITLYCQRKPPLKRGPNSYNQHTYYLHIRTYARYAVSRPRPTWSI